MINIHIGVQITQKLPRSFFPLNLFLKNGMCFSVSRSKPTPLFSHVRRQLCEPTGRRAAAAARPARERRAD